MPKNLKNMIDPYNPYRDPYDPRPAAGQPLDTDAAIATYGNRYTRGNTPPPVSTGGFQEFVEGEGRGNQPLFEAGGMMNQPLGTFSAGGISPDDLAAYKEDLMRRQEMLAQGRGVQPRQGRQQLGSDVAFAAPGAEGQQGVPVRRGEGEVMGYGLKNPAFQPEIVTREEEAAWAQEARGKEWANLDEYNRWFDERSSGLTMAPAKRDYLREAFMPQNIKDQYGTERARAAAFAADAKTEKLIQQGWDQIDRENMRGLKTVDAKGKVEWITPELKNMSGEKRNQYIEMFRKSQQTGLAVPTETEQAAEELALKEYGGIDAPLLTRFRRDQAAQSDTDEAAILAMPDSVAAGTTEQVKGVGTISMKGNPESLVDDVVIAYASDTEQTLDEAVGNVVNDAIQNGDVTVDGQAGYISFYNRVRERVVGRMEDKFKTTMRELGGNVQASMQSLFTQAAKATEQLSAKTNSVAETEAFHDQMHRMYALDLSGKGNADQASTLVAYRETLRQFMGTSNPSELSKLTGRNKVKLNVLRGMLDKVSAGQLADPELYGPMAEYYNAVKSAFRAGMTGKEFSMFQASTTKELEQFNEAESLYRGMALKRSPDGSVSMMIPLAKMTTDPQGKVAGTTLVGIQMSKDANGKITVSLPKGGGDIKPIDISNTELYYNNQLSQLRPSVRDLVVGAITRALTEAMTKQWDENDERAYARMWQQEVGTQWSGQQFAAEPEKPKSKSGATATVKPAAEAATSANPPVPVTSAVPAPPPTSSDTTLEKAIELAGR